VVSEGIEILDSPMVSVARRGPRPGPSLDEADHAEVIAHAVLAGHILPDVQERGMKAADVCRARISAFSAVDATDAAGDEELARLLADAETISLLRSSGRIERARHAAARRVRAAFAEVPGEFPRTLVQRSAQAAATAAGLRRMAWALADPAHVDATAMHMNAIRATRLAGGSPKPRNALAGREVASAAIAAALARAAALRLDGRLYRLRETLEVIAGQVREDRVHAGPRTVPDARLVRERVEDQLAAAAHERREQAAELAAQLIAELRPGGPPELVRRPPDQECLAWLHTVMNDGLYSQGDDLHTLHWLGSDPFGLRLPPPAPPFLAGLDFAELSPEHIASLFRRLSLTRAAPDAADLTPDSLECAELSVAERTEEQRRWGRATDSGAPLLDPVTRIPRVMHSIWFGRPPALDSEFLDNVGYAARRYAGELDYVLWTDIPRAALSGGMEGTDAALGNRARDLLAWAESNGVLLVNIYEVFHRDAPMVCQAEFAVEMSKQRPHGWAAASDILRLEVIERFGGFYADGDLRLAERQQQTPADEPPESLVQLVDRIAASHLGFTMDPIPKWEDAVNNDLIIAPAHHPVIRLWLEDTRVNYLVPQTDIVGGPEAMARHLSGMELHAMRYLAPYRTGRIHHKVLARLGLRAAELPVTQPPILYWSTCSWIPMNADESGHLPSVAEDAAKAVDTVCTQAEVISTLKQCVTLLDWQLRAREGNLYLTTVDPVIRGLPDPDAAWTATLIALGLVPPAGHGSADRYQSAAEMVTSVTYRRKADDGSTYEHVDLPPEAAALLEPHQADSGWLGALFSADGKPVWMLDECVQPALLRDVRGPVPGPLGIAAPFAQVVLDLLGRPLGLWFGPRWDSDSGGDCVAGERAETCGFATLPEGRFGLTLAATPEWSWAHEPALRPDTVAALLVRAGAAGRPVLMSVPYGTAAAARDFSVTLADLLGRPVDVIEGPLRPPGRPLAPVAVPSTQVSYREWVVQQDRITGCAQQSEP
jgi:hypothetical protein